MRDLPSLRKFKRFALISAGWLGLSGPGRGQARTFQFNCNFNSSSFRGTAGNVTEFLVVTANVLDAYTLDAYTEDCSPISS